MATEAPHYRIIFLGMSGVGKTTLALRMKYNRFVDDSSLTKSRGTRDTILYETEIDGEELKVLIDEPGGVEQFRSVPPIFYRNADAIILVYSTESSVTFDSLHYIVCEAKANTEHGEDIVWALFRNKCDLPMVVDNLDERVKWLQSQELLIDETALQIHCTVSAKTGENLHEALDRVVAEIHKRKLKMEKTVPPPSHVMDSAEQNSSSERETLSIIPEQRTQNRRKCCGGSR